MGPVRVILKNFVSNFLSHGAEISGQFQHIEEVDGTRLAVRRVLDLEPCWQVEVQNHEEDS